VAVTVYNFLYKEAWVCSPQAAVGALQIAGGLPQLAGGWLDVSSLTKGGSRTTASCRQLVAGGAWLATSCLCCSPTMRQDCALPDSHTGLQLRYIIVYSHAFIRAHYMGRILHWCS
jgi:hypothetical protein